MTPIDHDSNAAAERPNGRRSGERFDVAVVGAGQAGLAIGYWLARQQRRFLILEAGASVGTAWRNRWDSLRLFTPRRYDALPGLAFPGDPDGYPSRDEVADYLAQYAGAFDLPVAVNSSVESLTNEGGSFVLELAARRIDADQVVLATGPFQRPAVPTLAEAVAPEVFQAHSVDYRRPSDVPAGRVLVVGGGNTGYQLAQELAVTHETYLAVGSRQKPLPQRFLGRDLFWWLIRTGLFSRTVESRIGRRIRDRGDVLIGSSPRDATRHGVQLKPRAIAASGSSVRFADGTDLDVAAIIWATGYRPDYSWIELPVFAEDGSVRQRRGVTDVPGLYFLGLSWQHTRGSALLGWVKDDAEVLARRIATFAPSDAVPGSGAMDNSDTVDAQRPEPLAEGV